MQFLYPALTVGFFLALMPLLIHLINMMRHRRVQWAAMEFLLQSYKKHRKWVWLRQLLLLLARMAAIALVVAMLAQLVTQRRYEGLFGSTMTHHYVLIDDSMSMTDREGGVDAFDRALKFTRQLAAEAARQELRQRFTLVRYSTAAAAAGAESDAQDVPRVADISGDEVDSRFALRLEELGRSIHPTQLPVGPQAALEVVNQLMGQNGDENRIVYLVSDFRRRDWDNPTETRQLLSDLEKQNARIHLVSCVRNQRSNLAVTELKPTEETRASGVPLFMNVDVTNYGTTAAENVQLKVRTYFYADNAMGQRAEDRPVGRVDETPSLQIQRIEPGETVTQRVQVFFPEPGKHVVEAILPEDTVAADNRRWCVVEFPDRETALVIDGDPNQRNAFYLQSIFEPGQRARTGIHPDIQTAAFLRDATVESLRRYSAIYLLDVDRLDDRALSSLEQYVREGGGLAIFAGPQVNLSFYNEQLYRAGAGLMPLPLERDDLLDSDPLENAPDVEVLAADHPVFRELVQGQNPIIRMMHIERYLRPPSDWAASAADNVQVLARLRNRAPLAVEKRLDKGRVIVFTTTYAPYWNDIALGPGVIVALRLQSYLGSAQRITVDHTVASSLTVRLDGEKFRQDVRVFAPGDDPAEPLVIERSATKETNDARFMLASIPARQTDRSGVYEMWLNRIDGTVQADRFAVNVSPQEGDLAQPATADIVAKLDPVSVDIGYADQYETAAIEQAGFNQSLLLMCFLVALLLGEQILAYMASYHPSRRSGTASEARRTLSDSVARLRQAEDARWAHSPADLQSWSNDAGALSAESHSSREQGKGVSRPSTAAGGARS